MSRNNISSLDALKQRKAEVAALCKEKEQQIGRQIDYISDNIGTIALRSFIGNKGKKDTGTKAEIISFLVSEGVEVALDIKDDPSHFKNKIVDFIKKAASGVINILVK